jgi:hypothetical protein
MSDDRILVTPPGPITDAFTSLLKAGMVERRKDKNGKWITRNGQIVYWITPAGIDFIEAHDAIKPAVQS